MTKIDKYVLCNKEELYNYISIIFRQLYCKHLVEMGSSLSKVSREKLKRKNDPVVLSEDEEPSTLHCKRLKLDDTMEQEERSKTRDSQVPADEMRAMREQLSEFSTQSQAFTEILSSCLKCVECKEYPRGQAALYILLLQELDYKFNF